MSHEADIRRLTVDPGTIELAKVLDVLQARVDACCGTSGTNLTARTTAAESTPAMVPEQNERKVEPAAAETEKKGGAAPSGRGRKS